MTDIARPGDVLIVSVGRDVTMAIADGMRARLMEECPGLRNVLVIPGSGNIVIFRPERETDLT